MSLTDLKYAKEKIVALTTLLREAKECLAASEAPIWHETAEYHRIESQRIDLLSKLTEMLG